MFALGRSRRFDGVPVTSAYPPTTATEWTSRHVSKVPTNGSDNLIRSPFARAISALQGAPRRCFVGSDWQARLEEASLVTLAIDFALVVLGS
jgi:hypothetical protein